MQNGKGLTLLLDRKQDVIEVVYFHAKWQGVNLTFCTENRTCLRLAIFMQNGKGLTLLFAPKTGPD